jgi:hypothetical protein
MAVSYKHLIFMLFFLQTTACMHVDELSADDSDHGYDTLFNTDIFDDTDTVLYQDSALDSDYISDSEFWDTGISNDSDSSFIYPENIRCPEFQKKVINCGLATEGLFNCTMWSIKNDEECISLCVMASECFSVRELYCQGDLAEDFKDCVLSCYAKPENQFVCFDGSMIIPSDWICDGEVDCSDNSDEVNCTPDLFECSDGINKIPWTQVCDNIDNCPEHSDEYQCSDIMCDELD